MAQGKLLFRMLIAVGRLQGLRAPMPPIQFPLRPPAPPNTNIRVPTNPPAEPDGPRLAGNGQTADEHRPALAQPPIPKVRPQVPMPHYKGTLFVLLYSSVWSYYLYYSIFYL